MGGNGKVLTDEIREELRETNSRGTKSRGTKSRGTKVRS